MKGLLKALKRLMQAFLGLFAFVVVFAIGNCVYEEFYLSDEERWKVQYERDVYLEDESVIGMTFEEYKAEREAEREAAERREAERVAERERREAERVAEREWREVFKKMTPEEKVKACKEGKGVSDYDCRKAENEVIISHNERVWKKRVPCAIDRHHAKIVWNSCKRKHQKAVKECTWKGLSPNFCYSTLESAKDFCIATCDR